MKLVVKTLIPLVINFVHCSIDGISYLDELKAKDWFNNFPKRDNPCNPLYWYPKKIPDYCYAPKLPDSPNVRLKPKPTPPTPPTPPMPPMPPMLPMPPIPAPPGIIAPMIPPPIIPSPVIPSPLFPAAAFPPPMIPSPMISSPMLPPPIAPSSMPSPPVPSLTNGAPLVAPNPMIPAMPQYPYAGYQNPQLTLTYGQQTAGMVPGLPGIVSKDGGINILPFSDAYSDLLEKHKQKVIRRKLEKVIKRFEDYPRPKHFYRRKRYKKIFFDNE